MRVAAIDLGTNTTRLLVADVEDRRVREVERRTTITRLGEGVDARRRLLPLPIARVRNALTDYRRRAEELGAERTLAVATSAIRDAENGEAFLGEVEWSYGFSTRLLSGHDEALLMFRGVTSERPVQPGTMIVDVGGGSTEAILGEDPWDGGAVLAACSVDVGSVRLTERYLRSDPPTAAEIERARAEVDQALDVLAETVPLDKAALLVGVAGTVTTVTAHALGLPAYDSDAVDGAELPVATVRAACADLLGRTLAQRAELPYLDAGRVDVIGAGALVWGQVVERVHRGAGLQTVLASEHDVLDGIAWALATG
jgi:exopolyphosphatase/guanosine-5'-triphosphate,3'-diphosphate pyrophosphatase